MAKGFKHGSGGIDLLNLKVVGNPQPQTAKENTIWVDTDIPINGWMFSAQMPENPEQGMVWFLTATYSGAQFNALKKNGIMVYPMITKQYVDGAWKEKSTKQWQSGEWVEWWNGTLFDYGDMTHITGGYTTYGIPMTVTVNNDGSWKIKASKSTETDANTHVTMNSIDLTPYKSLCFVGNAVNNFPYMFVASKSSTVTSQYNGTLAHVDLTNKTGTLENPLKVDVSLINEECRIGFGSFSPQLGTITLQKMWLE